MRDFASLHADAWPQRLAGRAGLALLFAALMAFLAPFGTYRFGPVERVGYWTVQMAAWLALSLSAAWLMGRLSQVRAHGAGSRRLAATMLAALPMMIITGFANNMMTGWRPDASEVVELFVSITLIGGGYTLAADWLVDGPPLPKAYVRSPSTAPLVDSNATAPDAPTLPTETALIDRLPPHLRADILCLQVEDHYVRVHARDGSAMVLMRFSDALRGVGHISGSQVHRSWWVADDAVTALHRTGRTARLTLRNGASVPVSQPYLAHAMRAWGTMASGIA